MAQTSLTRPPRNLHFNNPENAKAAKAKSKPRAGSAPEYAALRRQQIIDLKVKGWTNQQIADHFGLSLITIKRDVAIIRRDGLIHKWENRIVGALMKKAVDKLGKALEKDDDSLEAVEMVFKRFDALSQRKHETEIADARGEEDDTLTGWVKNWLAAKAAESAPPPDAIDVELADSGANTTDCHPATLPDGNKAEGQSGLDPECDGGFESVEYPAEAAETVSPDPGQDRLDPSEAEGVGPVEHDPDRQCSKASD